MNEITKAAIDWIEHNPPELRIKWPPLRRAPPELRAVLTELRSRVQTEIDSLWLDAEGSFHYEVEQLFKGAIK